MTNPKEEDLLQSEKGQDHLASAIFRAFKAYKEDFEGTTSLAESRIGLFLRRKKKERKNSEK